jgi:hypothetical protein
MSFNLLSVVTLIYMGISISLWIEGNKGMSICFLGYVIANAGILVSMRT